MNDRLRRLVWVAVLPLLWEAVRRIGGVPELLMPSLPSILAELGRGLFRGDLVRQILLSLGLIAGGLMLSLLAAAGLTLVSGLSPWFRSAVDLLTTLLHPLPGIALLPLIILWIGTGPEAVLTVLIHSVVWPLAVNLRAAAGSLPRSWDLVARNLGLTPGQRFFRVILPAAAPYLLAGLKTGWARSWRALISAEMVFGAIAGLGGVGWYFYSQRVFMNAPGLYAGLLVIMVLGLVVEEGLLGRWESLVARRRGWRR